MYRATMDSRNFSKVIAPPFGVCQRNMPSVSRRKLYPPLIAETPTNNALQMNPGGSQSAS